jgi:hypothetical protein
LWPIGVGGRMPVGGDVTQFSIGLMAFLHRSLRLGRIPVWNALWGYGFPGLAESQMGVFYPPHFILYGLLTTEGAYTASLVLHTAWGALGAWWAARKIGISPTGAALSGFAWSTSGFFLIHLPHQWGYTAGSWMPWAFGLAWPLLTGNATPRTPFLLALVLTLQVLPGHFQLAFCTQVSMLLLGLWALTERALGQDMNARGPFVLGAVLAAVFPLAALQLWPTFRLARLAVSQRDFEYLSGFAATPIHLVSYVAPGLFHVSPLWRPLAWDPFHTSPEEHLAYVGLVPLFLALATVRYRWRDDPVVRALTVVALSTLIFSLGPYVPGFRIWGRWPGFSFFRAPARWSVASALALSLLAGRGYDTWRSWPRPGRSLLRFTALAALAPLFLVLGVELALAINERPGWPAVSRALERSLRSLPWPGGPSLAELGAEARRPQLDLRVQQGLARLGGLSGSPRGAVFSAQRSRIYADELFLTGGILAAFVAIAPFTNRPRFFAAALVVLTGFDLLALGRHRSVDTAPIRPLTEQSEVLARLARGAPAARIIAPDQKNLPMVAGVAPLLAYHTLDLPTVETLTVLAASTPRSEESGRVVLEALRATGTGVYVIPTPGVPVNEGPGIELLRRGDRVTVRDRALAEWLFGAPWVAAQDLRVWTFTLWKPGLEASKAWLVPLTVDVRAKILEPWSGDPAEIIGALGRAMPLETRSLSPERLEVDVQSKGPALVVVSQLADPQWRATWSSRDGGRPAEVFRAFGRPGRGAWQALRVPEPGVWTLRLDYDARDLREGMALSGLSWVGWTAAFLRWGRPRDSEAGEKT